MNSPAFSIIVPVYNVATYLRDCLDSVLAQTVDDWECLCVDDGSTDESGTILDEYAVKDPRFRIVHQENRGEGGARNAALSLATGRYICFLDGDDVLRNIFLQTLENGIQACPECDMVRVELLKFDADQTPQWPCQEYNPCLFDLSERIDFPQFEGYIVQFAFRRKVVEGLTFSTLIHAADRLFLAQVLERASCISKTGIAGYGYRQHGGSAVHSPMTARRFLDADRHRMEWLDIISRSKKQYTPSVMQFFYRKLTSEDTHLFFSRTPDKQNRLQIFPQWMDNLRTASRCNRFSRRHRKTLAVLGTLRSRCLMWILFESRPWLRNLGFRNPLSTFRK